MKLKTCRNCKAKFMPARQMQSVCGPMCGLERAKKKREAEAKAAKVAEKRADQVKRESMKTIAQLIADAQVAFNAFIRERDRHKGCFVCGCAFSDEPGRVMHAGHVRSRGAAGHLRFHEDNCLGECEGCNGPHGAKPHQIKAGAIARIGQARFDLLEADNEPVKWDRDTLRQIKVIYRAKARALRKETP